VTNIEERRIMLVEAMWIVLDAPLCISFRSQASPIYWSLVFACV